jgi:soluble lytic murein transglycosylase-like protein
MFVPTLRLSALAVFAVLPALLCAEEAASTRTTLIVKADNRSGRLVRSVVVAPKVVNPEESKQPEAASTTVAASSLADMIDSIAAKHDVEGPLVHSVIKAESNYNPLAVSPKGAQGLMQLIPATARRFGVENTFNPQQNIEGGVKYLKFLMELYHNDYVKVIAAYNAGEGAVTKYGGIPPYAETRNYVYQVGKNLQSARKIVETKSALPKAEETKPAAVDSNQPRSIQALVGADGKVYYKTQ